MHFEIKMVAVYSLLFCNFGRYIRRNQLDAGFPLFETESLKWPGFVEFDDVNGKVLTYSAQDGSVGHLFLLFVMRLLFYLCLKKI